MKLITRVLCVPSVAVAALGIASNAWAYDCGDYAYAAIHPAQSVLTTTGTCQSRPRKELLVSNFRTACPNYKTMGIYRSATSSQKAKIDSISSVYVCKNAAAGGQDSSAGRQNGGGSGGGSGPSVTGTGGGSAGIGGGVTIGPADTTMTYSQKPDDTSTTDTGSGPTSNPDSSARGYGYSQAGGSTQVVELSTGRSERELDPDGNVINQTTYGPGGEVIATTRQLDLNNVSRSFPGSDGSGGQPAISQNNETPPVTTTGERGNSGREGSSVGPLETTYSYTNPDGSKVEGVVTGNGPAKETVTGASDDCQRTASLPENRGKNYYCASTNTWITVATVGGAVAESVAKAGTQLAGQLASQKAASSKSMAESYKSAAKLTKTTGMTETTLGTAGIGIGAKLILLAKKHEEGGQKISGYAKEQEAAIKRTEGERRNEIINKRKLEDLANEAKEEAKNYETQALLARGQNDGVRAQALEGQASAKRAEATGLKKQARQAEDRITVLENTIEEHKGYLKAATEAVGEQTTTARKAKDAGAASLMKGMGQMIAGGSAIAAAMQMEKTADNLAKIQENSGAVVAPGFDMGADNLNPRSPTVISGNGTAPNTSNANAEDETKSEAPELGGPLGNDPAGGLTAAPPEAGDFVASGSGPAGGGSPGGLGGTSTSPTGSGESDTSPRSAANSSASYEGSGGGGGGYGGGGGGRGGIGGGGGLDLASMLGSLLPKKDDEAGGQDITAYGRAPAASDHSILGPNSKSLFERVADVTQAKFKSGAIK